MKAEELLKAFALYSHDEFGIDVSDRVIENFIKWGFPKSDEYVSIEEIRKSHIDFMNWYYRDDKEVDSTFSREVIDEYYEYLKSNK